MSGNVPCTCEEKRKPIENRNWFVIDRNCNYSAFNGYHCTLSDYSAVRCGSCRGTWRTKAAYVYDLRDAKPGDLQ